MDENPAYPTFRTLANVLAALPNIPLERIVAEPAPGTATERDVVELDVHHDRFCELTNGVLIEKTGELYQSTITVSIVSALWPFVDANDLGFVLPSSGMYRLRPGLIRIPDASYVSWKTLGSRGVPRVDFLDKGPDFVVEVLSPKNSTQEMEQKLAEYFDAGSREVWYLDPEEEVMRCYLSPSRVLAFKSPEVAYTTNVLADFKLPLAPLFKHRDRLLRIEERFAR